MEIGRTGCFVLGYDYPWICAWLLCRPGLQNGIYQPMRRNSSMSLRFLPLTGYQSIFLCGKSVQTGCLFWFRPVPKTRGSRSTDHGRYYRPRTREDRTYHDQDWRRSGKRRSETCGTCTLGENLQEERTRSPYRRRDHCRRWYACCIRIALRNGRSNGILWKSTQDSSSRCLSFFSGNGQRTRCLRNIQ